MKSRIGSSPKRFISDTCRASRAAAAPTWISFMRRGSISAPICAISAIWRATGIGLPETGCRMLILPPRRISPAWIFWATCHGRERDGKELVRPDKIASGLPFPAHGPAAGPLSEPDLRGSRFLGSAFRARLQAQAQALGFDVCRVTRPSAIPQAPQQLAAWLASGAAGSMDWLASTQARRSDPRKLWPETASILLLGMNYGPVGIRLPRLRKNRPQISPSTREAATITA